MNRTFVAAALIFAGCGFILAGCAGSSTMRQLNTSVSPLKQTQVRYSAVGASDAVGVGAIQCATSGVPPMPQPPSCPAGNGYVPDLAQLLGGPNIKVHLFDFGISGGVIGPDIQTDTVACFGAPGNFITNELPLFNSANNLVTVFAGGNDTNAIASCAIGIALANGDPTPFINAEIGKFGADYAALVQGIKNTSPPGVTIVVANLPNFALIPRGLALPPSVQALVGGISVTLDQAIINPSAGTTVSAVVDLLCNPTSYDPSNFSPDGFHPNAAGYANLAAQYDAQVLAVQAGNPTLPAASCPPITALAAHHAITRADAANATLWRY